LHITVSIGGLFERKVHTVHIKVAVGDPLKARYVRITIAVGSLFESKEFFVIVAVGVPFEGKVLTHYNCCWWPL